jgi:hypothetical protein
LRRLVNLPTLRGVPLALSNGDVILLVIFLAIPIGIVAFVIGAGRAYREIGKGQFGLDMERPPPASASPAPTSKAAREAEVRQLLEAKAYRQSARGEAPLDVEAELQRLLTEPDSPSASLGEDRQLVEEVRQLVVARNERRLRQGKPALDVDAEVERQLRELENLGQ